MIKYFNEFHHNLDKGCNKSGVYGSNCNMTCPTNCRNDTCHIQNGNCYTCKPGWTGISCKTSKRYIDLKLKKHFKYYRQSDSLMVVEMIINLNFL